jgi:ribosome-associated protein
MKKSRAGSAAHPLLDAIIHGIQEVKGKDIVRLDLRTATNGPADYFVICHGESDRQVEAIANAVEKATHERLREKPWHVEGKPHAEWVLLDFVDVVVHVFHRDKRTWYGLEDLWADATRQTFPNVA